MPILGALLFVFAAFGLAAFVSGCGRGPIAVETIAETRPESHEVFNSDRDSYKLWGLYARDGMGTANVRFKLPTTSESALIEMSAVNGAPMGINLPLKGTRGEVSLEYKVIESRPETKFGIFALPMQKTDGAPIEVGSKVVGDPNNVTSQYRTRFVVPATHNDGQWHKHTFSFDFTSLPDAAYTIIAPRINEIEGAKSPGKIQLRRVRIAVR